MRSFFRHPSDMPIEVYLQDSAQQETHNVIVREKDSLNNISTGGLSFRSTICLETGSIVTIRIPVVKPVFEARGRVIWCVQEDGYFNVGAEFIGTHDIFKARMVEQVCHIQHYKKEVYEKEGRILSGQEAALEWIRKFAPTFQEEFLKEKSIS